MSFRTDGGDRKGFFGRDQGVSGLGPFETEKSRYEVMDRLPVSNLTDERTADLVEYPLPGRSVHLLFTMKGL